MWEYLAEAHFEKTALQNFWPSCRLQKFHCTHSSDALLCVSWHKKQCKKALATIKRGMFVHSITQEFGQLLRSVMGGTERYLALTQKRTFLRFRRFVLWMTFYALQFTTNKPNY